jgi:hypothetical protein
LVSGIAAGVGYRPISILNRPSVYDRNRVAPLD